MKKFVLLIIVLLICEWAKTQIYEASDTSAFVQWQFIDADMDGENWTPIDLTGSGAVLEDHGECIISTSWFGLPQTPDNWMLSPPIDLAAETGEVWLNLKAGSVETTGSGWYQEYFAVYALEDSSLNTLQNAIPIWEGALEEGATMIPYWLDISFLAGASTVYVAIRHFNCTDENFIIIDDVSITNIFVGQQENDFEANMFPNPVTSDLNIQIEGQIQSVLIYGMDGKLVRTEGFNSSKVSLDLSDLMKGVYVTFIIDQAGFTSRQKFIKL